jgi:threonine/homoserine/homoserine lactone efflux protein
MEHASNIAGICLIYLFAAMSPGPNLLVIAATATGSSRTHGLCTALGVSTGTLVYTALTMLGLTVVLREMAFLSAALRLGGGAYLIYLGTGALRRAAIPDGGLGMRRSPAFASPRAAYASGLLTNLGNPKAIVFYLSLLGILVTPDTPTHVRVAGGGGIVCLSLGWHALFAVVCSAPATRQVYGRARRWIDGGFGCLLLAAGGRLVLWG